MNKLYNFILVLLITTTAFGQAMLTDANLNSKFIEYGKPVGVVSGGGNVSLSGTANYSIPIYTPGGINGMNPSVSINYSSGSGAGLLGYGWGLGAYSVITYDTKNLYNENVTAPDYIDTNNPYLFDGMRLIPVSGNTEFRTESESFNKITASSASAPASFTVLTKSGIKMEYGITSDSKLTTSTGVPVKWYLSKTTDNYGNYIEYVYLTTPNGEKVLDKILYTKNSSLSGIEPNKIQFNYTTRIDENVFYAMQAGSSTIEEQLKKNKLQSIDVFSEGFQVRRYEFNYGDDGLYSYLNEVIETGYDNLGSPAALNSTVFKYGNTPTTNVSENYSMAQAGKLADLFPGDFNGDGLDDLFVAYYTITGSYPKKYSDYRVYLRNTAGSAFPSTASASGTFPTTTFWNGISGTVCSLYVDIQVTDVDGNGKKDITIVKRGKSAILTNRLFGAYVLYGNAAATAFTLQDYTLNMTTTYLGDIYVSNYFLTGDFNGDGRTDWITTSGVDNTTKLHMPALNTYNKFISSYPFSIYDNCLGSNVSFANDVSINDFDADGKDDIIIKSVNNFDYTCQAQGSEVKRVYNIVHDSNNNEYEAIEIASNFTNTLDFTKHTGDFNGDGKTDVFIQPGIGAPTTAKIRYSTGRHQSAAYTLTLGEAIDTLKLRIGEESFLTGDFNGDGKSDILHYYLVSTTHNMVIYYSNGTKFLREPHTFSFPVTYRPFSVADFNGDGRDDIMDTLAGGTGAFYINFIKPKAQERLLTKVKDGYERETEFQYKLCTETSGIYTLATTETYPLRTYVPKAFKVYRMITPNGTGNMAVGNTTYTEYSYADAVLHAIKGGLGFKTFKTKDELTTLTSEQTNSIIDPTFYLFGATGSKTYYAATPATLLTQMTMPLYTVTNFGNKRYLLKTTQTTAINNVTDAKVVTDINMNDDGNITSSTETIKTVANVVKQTSTTSVNQYLNNGSWMPYLPEQVTSSNSYDGQPACSTATFYTYNSKGQPLTTTAYKNSQTDPGGSRAVVTTNDYDPTYGLLTKVTVNPDDVATDRYTRFEYFDNKRILKKTFVNAPAPDNELCTQEVEDYHKRTGLPTKVKHGYYTNTYTEYKYDAFGRTTEAKQMPNNITTYTTYSLDNTVAALFAISKIETTQAGAPTQTAFYDRFGRVVKSGAQNSAGNMVYSETTYNNFGNIATTMAPDADAGNITNTYTYFPTAANHFRLDKINNSLSGITQYTYFAVSSGSTKTKVTAPSTLFKEQTVDITGKLLTAADNAGSISYTYNSQGNATNINAAGVITTMDYDAYTGAQTILNEPNNGIMTYKYNGFGELIEQTDAKGVKYQLQYDVLGRLKQKDRVANGSATPPVTAETTTYEYVPAGTNGAQQLQYVKVGGVIKQTYGYDATHRADLYTEVVDGSNTFTTTTEYNTNNSIKNITYPNNYKLNYTYEYGNLKSVNDGTTTLYTTNTTNKYNQPTKYTLGNTKESTIAYFANGSPSNYTTAGIQNLSMEFNMATGNMTSRTDNTKTPTAQTESFTYEFDRLKTINTNSVLQTNVFAANGNISTKPDAGAYTYTHATKKNAVTNINFTCSGSVINYKEDQTLTYTTFNKVATATQVDRVGTGTPTPVTNLVTYNYNPSEARNKSELKKDGVTQKVRYYHGNYEKLDTYTGGVVTATKHIYYISGGNGLCAIATKEGSNPAVTYNYVYTDHLGSILKLTNSTGTVTAEQSFDAWGRLRNPNNWNDYSVAGTAQPIGSPLGAGGGGGWLTRGYTGHEHVPQVDLINMNGRMYDALLGRMLSPDRYVQDATSTQAYNRYSYVMNNPLKYTDPSGWIAYNKQREYAMEPDANNYRSTTGGSVGNWGFYANSGASSYNYSGPYSLYASNPAQYASTYGTPNCGCNKPRRVPTLVHL
jgi:RHS repeat-associated protein